MEHSMELVMDLHSNLPELLAVDLEQSRDIFRSRQLTAGAPAPGLADEGTKQPLPLLFPLPHSASYPNHVHPLQPGDKLANSNTPQTMHQKYSDIFAPLDFGAPKRDSISSSDYSADLEPTSISTRGDSVLTVDTWLEPVKQPPPTFLHLSPTSDHTAQSWIDLDVDEFSPITQRRRSSMADFPKYMQQLQSSNETSARTMSLKSQPIDATETTVTPITRKPLNRTVAIPERRSSLGHSGARAAVQEWAQNLSHGGTDEESLYFTSSSLLDNEPHFTNGNELGTSFLEDEANFVFQDSRPRTGEDEGGLPIAYGGVDCDEWLKSDLAYLSREDQPLPRPLPPTVQERVELYATNFPVTLLRCNHLLVEDIRSLSQCVRYNTEGTKHEHLGTLGHHLNNQQQSKPSKWKWPGSSASTIERQDGFNTHSIGNKQEWAVIRKIFPYGDDNLCDALYAYVLVYNYITSLCLRVPSHAIDLSRRARPWTARTDSSRLAAYPDLDADISTLSQLPTSSANAIPKKASRILGIEIEETPTASPVSSPTPPPSRSNDSRTSTFTSLRNIPSVLFYGIGQGQQRHNENRGTTSRPITPAEQRTCASRPPTPTASWAGTRPSTSAGIRAADQTRQLTELRQRLAVCCARLALMLQHADPNTTLPGSDKVCKAVPSFMRSLCENVRFTEEALARSQ